MPTHEVLRVLPDGTWSGAPPEEPREGCPDTVTLCGTYRLDRDRAHRLLAEPPEIVHLPAAVGGHRSLRAAMELLGMELEEQRPGTDAIVTSLLDTLLLSILRVWWESERAAGRARGWAEALADPTVAAALRAVHGDPARAWTVAQPGAPAGCPARPSRAGSRRWWASRR
ncbi:cupin domain-containing protein [Streptomyces sp. NPDC052107]|uniref:cupin domain-containing protein n=1 Tax=Streptomyces sp. NPDC052107 TaxID=3155632 RepID=UPI00344A5B9C